MIKPSRNVLIAAVVFVIAAAVLFAFTITAALDERAAPQPRPALNASVGGQLEQVAPMQFCADVRALQCDEPRRPVRMSVEPGKALVISLPDYISERPWFLTVQRYDTKLGRATLETITHLEPKQATLVLKSTPELLLAAVEINVPSAVQDASGNFIAQAVWGIDALAASVTKDFALVQKP